MGGGYQSVVVSYAGHPIRKCSGDSVEVFSEESDGEELVEVMDDAG